MSQFPSLNPATPAVFWEDIDEQTLGAPASAVTFSGIDTAFTFFRLSYWVKDGSGAGQSVRLILNNDFGATNEYQRINTQSTTILGARTIGASGITLSGAALDANAPMNDVVMIAKPVATEEAQVVSIMGQGIPANLELEVLGAQWNNTADLISRTDIKGGADFAANTRVLLEGAKPA